MADPSYRVLVVESAQEGASALCELLTRDGYEVRIAQDGAEAVRKAAAEEVDGVLVDLELPGPGMDGLQVLRMLRATQARRYLPVLMLSSREDSHRRVTSLRLGADDFVVKPWNDEELLARVKRSFAVRARFDELVGEAEELYRQSVTDGLTQIHNHRFLQERLKDEFRRAQRYDDPLALVLLDLDDFKLINDRFGNREGDRVLREVAQALKKCVRDTDVTARYGGEEFALLLPKTHLAGALTVAERVIRDINALKAGPTPQMRICASLGISSFPNRSVMSADQLFRTADEALYRSKREGRNKISLYPQATLFDSDSQAKAG